MLGHRVEIVLNVLHVEEEMVEEIMVQGGAVSPIVTNQFRSSEDGTDCSLLYQNIFYPFFLKMPDIQPNINLFDTLQNKISCRTLVKRVEVGLSVQQVEEETVEEIMVQGGAVSPIVTIEPRRRKFHKAITITVPLPERMSAQYLRRRQNESLKLSQKQQGKTPIGSFF